MGLESISTEEIAKKLRSLRDSMPDEDETLYQFGEFLADRLGKHPTLAPQGFNMTAELGLYDLQQGVDGFTNQPIRSRLVGYPSQIYALLRMRVPDLADATCPKDFAKGVRDFYKQVNAKLREDK